nr:hypothetical protein [Streptomyces sp. GMY02]
MGEVVVLGELVEPPGGVGFGGEGGGEVVGLEVVEGGVGEGCGGVDDAGEGAGVVDEVGEGVVVGDVAGDDADAGAVVFEFGGEGGGVVGVGSGAADEDEVACAVGGDEVAGDEGAEAAGAAGDEDGAVADGDRFGRCCGGEAGDGDGAVADTGLGLAGGDERGKGLLRGGVVIGVDEDDPVGVFGLCGAQKSPDGSAGEVVVVGLDDEGGGGVREPGIPGRG